MKVLTQLEKNEIKNINVIKFLFALKMINKTCCKNF